MSDLCTKMYFLYQKKKQKGCSCGCNSNNNIPNKTHSQREEGVWPKRMAWKLQTRESTGWGFRYRMRASPEDERFMRRAGGASFGIDPEDSGEDEQRDGFLGNSRKFAQSPFSLGTSKAELGLEPGSEEGHWHSSHAGSLSYHGLHVKRSRAFFFFEIKTTKSRDTEKSF